MKLFVLLLLSLSAASVYGTPQDDLRKGNLQFSVKFYKEVLRVKPNQNFVYSPFPLQTIMAALASAAPNTYSQTVTEIRNTMGLPTTNTLTEQAFQSILSDMNKSDDDFKIFDATKMYFAPAYSVQPWYRNVAQRAYYCEIENVNFHDSYNTVNNINNWVSKKTNNKITNFLGRDDVAGNTQNVLLNALYVMGKWEKPFDKLKNVWRKFYGPQATKEVEMMTNAQTYEYAETTNAKFLKMDLLREGGGAYMLFALPNKRDGLAFLEPNVGELLTEPSDFDSPKVTVTLPKFNINNDIKIKPILQNLGVNRLFNWGLELSGLRYPGHGYMTVSDVYQKSMIEVSEWGVTAASAAEAEVLVDSPLDHKEFNADHPFIFQVIVDGIILFAGRIVDP